MKITDVKIRKLLDESRLRLIKKNRLHSLPTVQPQKKIYLMKV